MRELRVLLAPLAFAVASLSQRAASATADGSLSSVAASAARELGPLSSPVVVVASPLRSDVVAPHGDDLPPRLASLLASALGGGASASNRALALPLARAYVRERSVPTSLVYLEVRVEAGELRVTVDALPAERNVWDRVRLPRQAPAFAAPHAFVHTPISAEVRSYLGPVHLEQSRVFKYAHDLGPVLAVACGDLDGVPGNELALVTKREIAWGHLERDRFVAARRGPSVPARVPVPLREPFARADVGSDGGSPALLLGWGDRSGAVLRPDLTVARVVAGAPSARPDDAPAGLVCRALEPAKGGFRAVSSPCDGMNAARPWAAAPGVAVDAWASSTIIDAGGAAATFEVSRSVDGALHLSRRGEPDVTLASDVGAQLALGDLDQDGTPDLVMTGDVGDDFITIASVRARGLEARFHMAAPAGVDAVAVCPPDREDAPSVVAVVGAEVWVVR